ncbi:sulfotransferase [Mesorhizobium sp. BH1-1-5]|uniref:tetratricopeptide repeat-containing sulfotransferase family protein n=1 Tax=Mesorhizobium sp. BH1-1-5 TaxID=2876661 RepID=UPI001CCDFEFE|nr:sulfotransferase [Mesorhizobium sp. BH1-1-5]MBZ9990276.1 sulfotransferase [Mesorhizobium sp. BH1-1-5]
MNNRLPPAWAKHIKSGAVSKPSAPAPRPGLPHANPSRPDARAQSDDLLLKQAYDHQQAKRLKQAQDLCLQVLARTPNHPRALYIMGTISLGYDDETALQYFARAAAEEPRNAYYQLSLGEAYARVGEHSLAIEQMRRALELQPDLVVALSALGSIYVDSDKPDLALPVYEKALKIAPDHPEIRVGLANALSSVGRMDEAAACLNQAIEGRINVPSAYYYLVNTRKFTDEPPELRAVLGELDNSKLDPGGSRLLHHAAGKVLNDLKRYDEAFDHFRKAKQVSKPFDIDRYRRWVDALIELFTPGLFAAGHGFGNPSEVPVFVVGMPRSGTTLTEQILASHPDVYGAGELARLGRVANAIGLKPSLAGKLNGRADSITPELSNKLASEHLSYLAERSATALRVVDKMPHNFELIGLVSLLFPKARIIHCRRDAIDNCVSCFVLPFNSYHSYSNDLRTLGLYYREYDRLMRHWNEVLPGRIFENRYETLVDDQEAQSRRLIEYIGLPWDDACLRFFDKEGSVTTASRWQVRQPIYKTSVKRWKNYENEIQPLIEALGDLADT